MLPLLSMQNSHYYTWRQAIIDKTAKVGKRIRDHENLLFELGVKVCEEEKKE